MKSLLFLALLGITVSASAQDDAKVEQFLKNHRSEWHDLNVPFVDGQTLHDIIVKNHYTSALEIGTSTGHSTIWLAWAMSKTGGKVISVELNAGRQAQARKNLEEAGLLAYVDLRLGNAHDIVKQLEGPFDFVFSDADKDWYQQYFLDVDPKLKAGGCFTSHNVTDGNVSKEYVQFVQQYAGYTSTIDRNSRAGILISYKKK